MSLPVAEYRPHHPQESDYYHCVEDYLEAFVRDYDEHFSRKYEFWRPYIEKVIYRYLDCCDLSHGFARVKCKDCGDEYLLAFSCKRRHFCPSCHQKRVVDQKIYEVALGLPEMQGAMRIISFIEDPAVIGEILTHLGYGSSGQGRRRKSTTRQISNTPLLIFKSNHTLTLSEPVLDLIGKRPRIYLG